MSDSDRPDVNPYAPTATECSVVMAGAAGIPLGDSRIAFSGALHAADVTRALGSGPAFKWYVLFALLLMLQLGWMITAGVLSSGMTRFLLMIYVLPVLMISLVLWLQSARYRARQTLRRHPRLLTPMKGHVGDRRIFIESEHGWSDVSWESIMGIKLKADLIVLTLNPQHANLIILPKRMFAPEDWPVLHQAVGHLAPRLPFRSQSARLGTAAWMTTGDLEPLRGVADGAVRLSGVLGLGEILRSRYGLRIFRNLILLIIVVCAVFGGLYWMLLGADGPSWVMLLLFLMPALLVLRLVRLGIAAWAKASQPLLKLSAAVADEGIWMSTPRGTSFNRWSAFGDAIVGRRLILLRETPHSISLTPLSRSMLSSDDDWASLVRIVTTNVGQGID